MNDLEKLLSMGKITTGEFDIFCIFHCSEQGKRLFDNLVEQSFMEEPSKEGINPSGFAFIDGRRSVFRDMKMTINRVKEELTRGQSDQQ